MNSDNNNHLALSEEVNAAFAGLATLPDQVGFTVQQQSKPASTSAAGRFRWLTDAKREEVYELQFPFELAGVEYRKITVRRLSAGEVDAFVKKMREAKAAEVMRFPMYFVDDAEILDAAWNALDDDDVHGLETVATKLLPARFRQAAG